ncbi:ABC transporter substrate-binding protein [Oceanobacter mangrovi]|uniref:ABC transporter substrate-binding protein n=1 Tax=Oceanobacter mangrovi TaxID=2862510 RepID=UPI001C8E1FE3|nr:ABC transporter substrate-binding protein [Oceanobacter mangrovi]
MHRIAALLLLTILMTANARAGDVEVLHFLTSAGEASAIQVLKQQLEQQGHHWKDASVTGGGGDSAMVALQARIVAGFPPSAAQLKGPLIQQWAREGLLTELDDVAVAGHWDQRLPEVIRELVTYQGHYVAVPINIHRVNGLWANPALFRQYGLAIPTSWDEFFDVARQLQEYGITPLAQGGQAWQDGTLFEVMALGIGGADFYRRALVELDPAALSGPTMIKVFETFKRSRDFIDADVLGRDWNIATSMVVNGQAAMQIMGDWAKGEFTSAGKNPGVDFVCIAAPDTSDGFIYNVDSFAMFQLSGDSARQAQADMAKLMMEPAFQQAFNLAKGSIPARQGMDRKPFDSCAQASMNDFMAAAAMGKLVPSIAHGMAQTPAIRDLIVSSTSRFYHSRTMTASQAVAQMAKGIQALR